MSTARQITKIRTGMDVVDRAVAHMADVLNPLLKDLPVQSDFVAGTSGAAQVGGALVVAAGSNTWTDLPGTAQNFTAKSAARPIRAQLTFTAFANGASGLTQVRLFVNGNQVGVIYPVFWNTVTQHQSWTFVWMLSPGALGAVGAISSVRAQVISPTGSAAQLARDANDSSSLVMEEMG